MPHDRCSRDHGGRAAPAALQDEDGIVWLDLNGDGDEEVLAAPVTKRSVSTRWRLTIP
jgi:hypothetical protein